MNFFKVIRSNKNKQNKLMHVQIKSAVKAWGNHLVLSLIGAVAPQEQKVLITEYGTF